jgi:hypothetical protein
MLCAAQSSFRIPLIDIILSGPFSDGAEDFAHTIGEVGKAPREIPQPAELRRRSGCRK